MNRQTTGLELDDDVVEILAEPVEKEAGLLDAVRATDGDESVEKAAATVARGLSAMRDAYGDRLPAEVVKAMREQMNDDELDDLENDEDDDVDEDGGSAAHEMLRANAAEDARRTNERIRKAGEELRRKRFFRALEARSPSRTPEQIAKSAEQRLEDVAVEIRKGEPALTREQAFVRALDENPDLVRNLYGKE